MSTFWPLMRRFALALGCILAIYWLGPVSVSRADTFGYNSIYGTSQSNVRRTQIATRVTLGAPGTITSITAYVGGHASQSVRYAIYSDTAGEPGSLLAQSANSATTNAAAWKTISVPQTYLAPGNYWLVLCFENNSHLYRYDNTGGTSRVVNNNAVSNGFLGSWGTSASSGHNASLFMPPTRPTPVKLITCGRPATTPTTENQQGKPG